MLFSKEIKNNYLKGNQVRLNIDKIIERKSKLKMKLNGKQKSKKN